MTTRACVVVLVSAMLWSAASPMRARACSLLPACQARPTLWLVGDVTARPRNACIGVQYTAAPTYPERVTPSLAYVASDGTHIALEATEVHRLYCPREPLAADTDYVLVGPELDATWDACSVVGEVELLAFHTGSTLDTVPPSAPGTVEDVAPCHRDECPTFTCCGPYDTLSHRSAWSAATDDGTEVAYVIDGELRADARRTWAESPPRPPYDILFEREPLDVRAVDVAGNVGPPATHGARCVGWPVVDAGVIDSGVIDASVIDAGVIDAGALARIDASSVLVDASSEEPTSDANALATDAHLDASSPSEAAGGCSTTRSSRASGVFLVLLGLVVRRRRG